MSGGPRRWPGGGWTRRGNRGRTTTIEDRLATLGITEATVRPLDLRRRPPAQLTLAELALAVDFIEVATGRGRDLCPVLA